MPKMKLSQLEQLDLIEQRCNELEAKQPKRKADYSPSFTNFDAELRQGIVFYRFGWGWRLRVGWRETLKEKRRQLITLNPTVTDADLWIALWPYLTEDERNLVNKPVKTAEDEEKIDALTFRLAEKLGVILPSNDEVNL